MNVGRSQSPSPVPHQSESSELCIHVHVHVPKPLHRTFPVFPDTSGLASCVKGGPGGWKEKGRSHPLLSLAFTSPPLGLGQDNLRISGEQVLPALASCYETKRTSWFAPPNCVIADRVLKIVIFPCIFPSLTHLGFFVFFWAIT
jgi:hypothetical protein